MPELFALAIVYVDDVLFDDVELNIGLLMAKKIFGSSIGSIGFRGMDVSVLSLFSLGLLYLKQHGISRHLMKLPKNVSFTPALNSDMVNR